MAEEGKTNQGKEKTIHQTILKKMTLILKAKHRLWFLDKCIDLRIVPQTLQVKPPKNDASQKSTTWNNYVKYCCQYINEKSENSPNRCRNHSKQ